MTQFDFNSITDLGTFWDGSANAGNWGGKNLIGGSHTNSMSGDSLTSHYVDSLYQNLVGRNADPSGRQYWIDQISSGANTYQTLADTLKGSTEYTDQQAYLADNTDVTASDLKGLDSAYVSPYHSGSGSAAAGWRPGDRITAAHADSIVSGYSDQTNNTVGDIRAGITGGTGNNGSTSTGVNTSMYDDSALRGLITGLTGQLGDLRSAFDAYLSLIHI